MERCIVGTQNVGLNIQFVLAGIGRENDAGMDRIANRRHKNGERDAEDTEDMDVEQLNPREMMLEDSIE